MLLPRRCPLHPLALVSLSLLTLAQRMHDVRENENPFDFDCHAGDHRDWSKIQMDFCCRTQGKGCPLAGLPFSNLRTCKGLETDWEHCPQLPPCPSCEPQDCSFKPWGDWFEQGACTGLCMRHRGIAASNNECGSPCRGAKIVTKPCKQASCRAKAKDCAFSSWSQWSECKGILGQRTRHRNIAQALMADGTPCSGNLNETAICGGPPIRDCRMSNWGGWTPCSASCGGGWRAQMRRVLESAKYGGKPCDASLRRTANCNTEPCEQAKDCKLSHWTDWSSCEDEVDHLQSYRSRRLLAPVEGLGNACDEATRETRGCTRTEIPKPCKVSSWGDWTKCDNICDGGQRYRSRMLEKPPEHGGACDAIQLSVTEACNERRCGGHDNDCLLSEWSTWATCSATCGGGVSSRTRSIIKHAYVDGIGCQGTLHMVHPCNVTKCNEQDCEWNDWEEWNACDVTCGGGSKRRARSLLKKPNMDGKSCTAKSKLEVDACNTQTCMVCVNGKWGSWTDWTPCSATCSSGYRSRQRSVTQAPNFCGKPAVGLENMFEKCEHGDRCPDDKDCLLSGWTTWSDCSCSCFGMRERHRRILQSASALGKACDTTPIKEIEQCNPGMGQALPDSCFTSKKRPCTVSEWSKWSDCSASCAGGHKIRSRDIIPAMVDGEPCTAALRENVPCMTNPCHLECFDCIWNDWQDWSDCGDVQGQKYRHRAIKQMPNHCGKSCDWKESKETTICTGNSPKQWYCAWSDWSSLGNCTGRCGSATSVRQRILQLHVGEASLGQALAVSNYKDLECSGTQMDQIACPFVPCGGKVVDCKFGGWSSWTKPAWSLLCERSRGIVTMNDNGGKACSGPLVETKRCLNPKKKIDCEFSDWSVWSRCKGPTDQRERNRAIVQLGEDPGKECDGILAETSGCSDTPRALVNCRMESWGDWSQCSVSCGGGVLRRARHIERRAANGGKACSGRALEETASCNLQRCRGNAIDCEITAWSIWGKCSSSYQTKRSREILRTSKFGGRSCNGALTELMPCPISADCIVTAWTNWDSCDKTCGNGQHLRQRVVAQNPKNGGKPCPEEMVQTRGCNTMSCNVTDCEVALWSDWGPCSTSCGVGQQTRQRAIARFAQEGGLGCNTGIIATKECFIQRCPTVDCQWEDWSDWSACTCECEGGQRSRNRNIKVRPLQGGLQCAEEARSMVEPCNTQKCKQNECIDGLWDSWNDWGVCTLSCKGGVTFRSRNVLREATHCGLPAVGKAHEVASCNENISCVPDIDCRFGDWGLFSDCTLPCHGIKRRERIIVVTGRGKGKSCEGALQQINPCNPSVGENIPLMCRKDPPVDCLLSQWTRWTECSTTCGVGQRSRQREVLRLPSHGGKMCEPSIDETDDCGNHPCEHECVSQNCRWGDWGQWSACDKCGGQKRRFRHVVQPSICGGANCDFKEAEHTGPCERQCHSPSYCGWSDWFSWGACSATCGHGSRQRQRTLVLTTVKENDVHFLQKDATQIGEDTLDMLHEALSRKTASMEAKRIQELVMAFVSGIVGVVALIFLARARGRRPSRSNPSFPSTPVAEQPGI